jgi:hypothetical protein
LSINTQRIYLLGFSGGARVANAMTLANSYISGVICCGAAAPAMSMKTPRSAYTFLGLIGNEDFNFTEMKKYDLIELAGHKVKHTVLTFDGKHEWPKAEVMEEGFLWMLYNDMRKKLTAVNDTLVASNLKPTLEKLKDYQLKKDVYQSYLLCTRTINFYDGLADLSYCYEVYTNLKTNTEVDKQLKLEEISWQKEATLKQFYTQAFQEHDYRWWQQEITDLNKKIKSEKDKSLVLIYKRTLGFLSLAAYMQTTSALNQNALPAAELFSKIYVLVDPTNSEAYYLTAFLNAIKGNAPEVNRNINEAQKNGFKDINRLQNDTVFNRYRSDEEFIKAVQKMK